MEHARALPANQDAARISTDGLDEVFSAQSVRVATVGPPSAIKARELTYSLKRVYDCLQAANYRVGYLEAKLEQCRKRTKSISQCQASLADGMSIEEENVELRSMLPLVTFRAGQADGLAERNEALKRQLEVLKRAETPSVLKDLSIVLVGSSAIDDEPERQKYTMSDYFAMIERAVHE